ncbi:MAG: PTS sugar transporter subunit IIA [Pirellulaceae bacterium]
MEDYFDVDSLAKYLHLTPEQIRKMADRGKLPGQRVSGEWRFPRREIFHWFEERIGISDDTQLQQYERIIDRHNNESDSPTISIDAFLPLELVWLDCRGRSKSSLIRDVCEFVAHAGYVWDSEKLATAIQNREHLNSTALENGVALLHPRRPQLDNLREPFLALIRTPSAIPFGGPRGTLTDLFFLVASDSETFHLKILARLARLLGMPNVISELRQAEDAVAAKKILTNAEQLLG